VRKISLPPQENLEARVLHRDDGASFGVVADALATGETRLGRRCRARIDGRVGSCGSEIGHIRSPARGLSAASSYSEPAGLADAPANRMRRRV
jgi:hypothetical protein